MKNTEPDEHDLDPASAELLRRIEEGEQIPFSSRGSSLLDGVGPLSDGDYSDDAPTVEIARLA